MTMNCSSLSKAQDLCSQSFVCQDFRNKNGIREGLLLAIANSTMDEVTKIIDREDEISQKIKEEVISQAVRCGRNYLLAMFNKKGQWITQQDRGDAVAAASEGNYVHAFIRSLTRSAHNLEEETYEVKSFLEVECTFN